MDRPGSSAGAPPRTGRERVVAIAASVGGLAAVKQVLAALPRSFPWPVVVLIHTSPGYRSVQLDEILSRSGPLPVCEARARMPPLPGVVHLAPPGYHLLMEKERRFALSVDEKVAYVRPSADVLFDSLADAYGPGAVGVILTGANEDGAEGLAAIRGRGGLALVQDPQEAHAPQMPEAALRVAGADWVLSLHDIGGKLAELSETRESP